MTRRLILVKHSLPALDPSLPASQWQLSEAGRQRCDVLAQALTNHLPCKVYASAEPKAAQTAALAAEMLGLPWQIFPGLHEHERERAPFTSPDQFRADIRRLFDRPAEVVYGEESADQAHQRFAHAIQAILQRHEHESDNLVIVAHGTVISLYVSRCCGLPAYPLWEQLGLPSFVALDLPIELDQRREVGHPVHIFNPYHPGAPV